MARADEQMRPSNRVMTGNIMASKEVVKSLNETTLAEMRLYNSGRAG